MDTPSFFTSSSNQHSVAEWKRFVKIVLSVLLIATAGSYLFVLLVDPYGSSPYSIDIDRVEVAPSHQRLFYPLLAKNPKFDSALIGNSTIRLLRPDVLGSRLGGNWVNLAMDAASPWEQNQIFDMFVAGKDNLYNIFVGVDYLWCDEKFANQKLVGHRLERSFPYWLYDDRQWNNFPPLNITSLKHAWLQLLTAMGYREREFGSDGYTVFTDPMSEYDVDKARFKIYGSVKPRKVRAVRPPVKLTELEIAMMKFPEIGRLDSMLESLPASTRKIMFFVPYHSYFQARSGSEKRIMWNRCKKEVVKIARSLENAHVIDFMIRSGITTKDANYWDHKHYTVEVGDSISKMIGDAVINLQDTEEYRVLHPME